MRATTTAQTRANKINRQRLAQEQRDQERLAAEASANGAIAATVLPPQVAFVEDAGHPNYLMPGEILFLRVDQLWTPDYQRKLQQTRVNRIARNLDPRLLGVLLVTEREGHSYVIDGIHRLGACVQAGHGDKRVRCLLIPLTDYKEEAELFVQGNNRDNTKPLSTGEVFHARIEQGDPVAHDIQTIATAADLKLDLMMDQSTTRPDTVRAIATLERVYRNGGPDHLADVLATISDCYPEERDALTHEFLSGMHHFLWRYHGRVDRTVLRNTLRGLGIDGLQARALMAKASGWRRSTRSGVLVGMTILDVYNDQRSARNRLPRWELMPQMSPINRRSGIVYFPRPERPVVPGEGN